MQLASKHEGLGEADAPQSPSSYHLRIVTEARDLASLEADWRALEARTEDAFYFTSYDWCSSWWQWFGCHSGRRLGVLAAYDGAGIQAILPLTTAKAWFFTSARLMGDDTGQYADCLVATDRREDEALIATIAEGLKTLGVDRITLSNCREDSALNQLLGRSGSGQGWVSAAEHANVEIRSEDFDGYDAYLASRSSSLKKNLRRRRRKLAELGDLRCERVTDPAQMAAIASRIVDLKLNWLAEYGLHGRFLAQKGLDGWMSDVMHASMASGQLHLSVLWLDDKICAAQLAFERNSKVIGYFSAFDLEYSSFAVGKLHIEDQIADVFKEHQSLDLMPPTDDYKLEWGVSTTKVAAYTVPLSPLGALVTRFYNVKTRAMAKDLYLKLPETMRAGTAAKAVGAARWLQQRLVSLSPLSGFSGEASGRRPTNSPSLAVKVPKGNRS